jgi:1,4-alpha-glucan branching enzyme
VPADPAPAAAVSVAGAAQPVVRQLLLDALRWWVAEYQVDGFCFVNAENLTQVCAVGLNVC